MPCHLSNSPSNVLVDQFDASQANRSTEVNRPVTLKAGYSFPKSHPCYATYTMGNAADMDADGAASDSAMISRALEILAGAKAQLLALSTAAYNSNPSGKACDAIEDAAGAFEDIECDLQIARTGSDEIENAALLSMEVR
jgi:hypothetical protein